MQSALYLVLRGPEWMDSRMSPPGAPSARRALELGGALGACAPDTASPSPSQVTSLTCLADNLRVFLPAKAWVSYPGISSFLMRAGPMLGMSLVVCLQLGIET